MRLLPCLGGRRWREQSVGIQQQIGTGAIGMATCGVCGNNSIFPENYGSLTICKKCAMKIHTPMWKNNVYSTNAEVEEERDSVLRMAGRSGFPKPAIDALAKYFNDQIIEGLVKIFVGGAGQNLALFDDRFSVDTQEDFNSEEVEEAYRALMTPALRGKCARASEQEERGIDGEVLAGAAHDILSGIARGGGIGRIVVRASAGAAAGMVMKPKYEKAEPVNNIALRVTYGMRTYALEDFGDVLLRLPVGEEEYGFLEFQKGPEPNATKDVYFFFKEGDSYERAAKELHSLVQEKVARMVEVREKEKREAKEAEKAEARAAKEARDAYIAEMLGAQRQTPQLTAPDKLMKWKQLLDADAISQEDYDAKKAQLLGL